MQFVRSLEQYSPFISLIAALATIVCAYVAYKQWIKPEKKPLSKFAFDCLTVDQLFDPKVLQQKLILANADIRYVPRLPVDQQQEMMDEWRNILNRPEQPRLLVQGIPGLGKTREVIEFLRTMDRELPTGKRLTILIPRPNMDVPQGLEILENLPHENLVLLLNDLHRWYEKGRRVSAMPFGAESEPFHSRLQNVIAFFEEKWTRGYGPFRIIATARSEPVAPEFWEHISPSSPFWNTFAVVELKRLRSGQVSGLIDAAATKFSDISVDDSAKEIIADKNDGTFGSIILYLAREKTRGSTVINKEMAREFTGVYGREWEERVYTPYIKPYPDRIHVISALSLLDQAGVPFIKEVVIELAARLWHIRQPLWWRRRGIRKALVTLRFLIQESEVILESGRIWILSCPEAYFENRGDLIAEISTITSTLLAMMHNRKLRPPLFDPLFNFGLFLQDRYYDEQAEWVFARLVKLYPTSAETRYEYGYTLFWKGHWKQAEREIAQAIILNPSYPRYHLVHGDILSLQAMFTEAVTHYKTAIRLTSHWDAQTPWILYNYANYLLAVGMRDEAISYLEQLLDISPDYVSARCVLALTLMDKGEQDKAIEQANLAVRTIPWSVTGYQNVARVHKRFFDNPRKAVEYYSKAIEMGRGSAAYAYDAYLERALCYIQLREQQLAHQDLAMARKAASTLIRRCPNNYEAIYYLAFTYLAQGDTRRAIQTIRRAQNTCALPAVISKWAEETQRLSAIAPTLTGLTGFLDTLEHSERLRRRIIPDVRKPMASLKPIEPTDESLGRRLERVADLRRVREVLQAKTIEVLEQGVRVVLTGDQQVQALELDGVPNERVAKAVNIGIKESQQIASAKIMEISGDPTAFFLGGQFIYLTQTHPDEKQPVIEQSPAIYISLSYVEDSIEKVSCEIQDEYFNLIIIPADGLLFSDKDVVFTHLPILEKEQIKKMERTKDNTVTKFAISIPYKEGSIEKVSYNIANTYFHLVLYGSIASSFDESKVKFARSAEKASLGEQQESGST